MSDLLKKKKTNLLSKSDAPKPTQPYEQHSLIKRGNINEEMKEKTKIAKVKKTTTIRCDSETSMHLSAILTCQDFNSVNEALVYLIDLFEGNLTADERREIAQVKSVLMRKLANK